MNDIIEMITAKNKAVDVIESCRTKAHISAAKTYIELFKNRFNDFLSYNELVIMLDNKKESFKNYDS